MPSFLQTIFYILPYYNYNVTRKNLTISIDYLYNNYGIHYTSVSDPFFSPGSGSDFFLSPEPDFFAGVRAVKIVRLWGSVVAKLRQFL